ncbi:pectin methylesterase pme8A [Moraxella macacae 0408225]|uniref:Pectin methylesterase pme8A n=1 Tax=Moraxella macacae 0408225 TaxID=1230338 RepID=L2F9L0_9GAMM|nr:hypothetical protein [Moraxella macacae]ELA09565.1 pectin methylesterase pme8A [Moraxella macacae 0408225]
MKPTHKNLPRKNLWLAISAVATLSLTACGGGGNDNKNHSSHNHAHPPRHSQPTHPTVPNKPTTPTKPIVPQTKTGVFLDSAVEGLEVLQNNKPLGKTNAKGEFSYNTAGGALTFKLGELTLGLTTPKSVVTPDDLNAQRLEIIRTLQILQSADGDNNLDNGIQIKKEVADRFKPSDFQDLIQQQNDDTFNNKLKAKLDTNRQVQDKQKAIEHLIKTLQTKQITHAPENAKLAEQFVGYWEQSCDHLRDQNGDDVFVKQVFQLVKSKDTPNTLVATGKVLTREYKGHDCTGSYEEENNDSAEDLFSISVITDGYNSYGQQEIKVLFTEKDANAALGKTVWLNNNTYTNSGSSVSYTRASKLAFDSKVQ